MNSLYMVGYYCYKYTNSVAFISVFFERDDITSNIYFKALLYTRKYLLIEYDIVLQVFHFEV